MLRKATEADKQLQMLKDDILEGQCRNSLHQYTQIFGELAVVDGLVVRGEQLVIPKELWKHVIQVATWARTRHSLCSGRQLGSQGWGQW